jgi:deazaflavin-dependent oxidoreductase (nitroreductase family)
MGEGLDPTRDGTPAKPPRPPLAVIRPFTTHVFNPISRRFARWLPGFGILGYRGRKTAKAYRTPLNIFRHGDDWVVALTYGSDVQWVKNVLAAGEATLEKGRRRIRLREPELIVDPQRRLMPFGVRQVLGLMRVSEFMRLRPAIESRPDRSDSGHSRVADAERVSGDRPAG